MPTSETWREGDHRERWAGPALLLAENQVRRLNGYKETAIGEWCTGRL